MANLTATVTVDSDEFVAAVSSLAELLERLPELVNGLVGILELGSEIGHIKDVEFPAGGAGVPILRVGLKPSDRLLKLVAALQACERELLVAKELAHV